MRMAFTYEQASQRVYCASRLIDYFRTPRQGNSAISDGFYWGNARFLDNVVGESSANRSVDAAHRGPHDDFSLFLMASAQSGVVAASDSELHDHAVAYKRIIEAYGSGTGIPQELGERKDEMLRVFGRVMRIGADICRRNPPSYHRLR